MYTYDVSVAHRIDLESSPCRVFKDAYILINFQTHGAYLVSDGRIIVWLWDIGRTKNNVIKLTYDKKENTDKHIQAFLKTFNQEMTLSEFNQLEIDKHRGFYPKQKTKTTYEVTFRFFKYGVVI